MILVLINVIQIDLLLSCQHLVGLVDTVIITTVVHMQFEERCAHNEAVLTSLRVAITAHLILPHDILDKRVHGCEACHVPLQLLITFENGGA